MANQEITKAQIEALMNKAGQAGDLAQVEICERALAGDVSAAAECLDVILDAEGRSHEG